ncbi:uncharacterized protein LOC125029770 [Penaeus chinensis]|uniref:uncharacterized protein LOC125029770 n=1 Tax=Penaeus chinensis TaxID=139456 RepID=UPI001FB7318B|nr:uncharacterized protein LOC125029770 [Penaeus chinensis]
MAALLSAASSASGTRRVKNVTVLTIVEDIKEPYKQEVSIIFFNKLTDLLSKVRAFVEEIEHMWESDAIHPGDGTELELHDLLCMTQRTGIIAEPLPGYTNCWLAHSEPGYMDCLGRSEFLIPKEGFKELLENENEAKEQFLGSTKESFTFSKVDVRSTDSSNVVDSKTAPETLAKIPYQNEKERFNWPGERAALDWILRRAGSEAGAEECTVGHNHGGLGPD